MSRADTPEDLNAVILGFRENEIKTTPVVAPKAEKAPAIKTSETPKAKNNVVEFEMKKKPTPKVTAKSTAAAVIPFDEDEDPPEFNSNGPRGKVGTTDGF